MARCKYILLMALIALLLGLANPLYAGAADNSWADQLHVAAAGSDDSYKEIAAPSGVVSPDRIWTVRFSQSVDISSLNVKNIYVRMNGESVSGITLESVSSDNKVIEVRPPAGGYAPGDYELFITPGLFSSDTGKVLNRGVKMKFTVAAPLSIGAILPISSSEGDCGIQQQKGMELAIKHINAQGGINGQPLSIIYKDDAGDSTLAVNAFQELTFQGVPLVVGLPFNSAALAVAPLAEQKKLPVILSTASDSHLANYKDYVFKISPLIHYESMAIKETLRDMDRKRVAIIYNDTEYGRDLTKELSEDYTDFDYQIVAKLPCPVGTTDFSSQMAAIDPLATLNDSPLTIIFIGHAADLIKAMYAAGKAGISAWWLGSDETVEGDIPQLGEWVNRNLLAVHPMAIIDNDPVSETFKTEWAKYNETSPNPDAAFAYDTVLLAAQTLQKAGTKGGNLDQALHESTFNGVTGHKSFDADGCVNLALYDLWHVEDNSWQVQQRWLVSSAGSVSLAGNNGTNGLLTANTGNTIEQLGQWPGDNCHTIGTPGADGTLTATADGISGEIFFAGPLYKGILEKNETYQITIDAAISCKSESSADSTVFNFNLYKQIDSNNKIKIADDMPVRVSAFGDKKDTKQLSFLFTIPEEITGEHLYIDLNYKNKNQGNPYDITLKQVTLNRIPVSQTTVEMIKNSTIINSAFINTSIVTTQMRHDYTTVDISNTDVTVIYPKAHTDINPTDPDDDHDGIPNKLEINGYIFDENTKTIKAWDGNASKKYYKTDPNNKNTDRDPWSDYDEVTGNVPTDVVSPDPLIPNMPIISMELKDYTVTLKEQVTLSDGSKANTSFTEATSHKDVVTDSKEKGIEASAKIKYGGTDQGASFSVTAHYNVTHTDTDEDTKSSSTTNGTEQQWGHATCTNTDEAGLLSLNINFKNTGTASVYELKPSFNVYIGNKLLNTISFAKDEVINLLGTYKTNDYNSCTWGINSTSKNNIDVPLKLSIDALRALQCGAPITLESQPAKYGGQTSQNGDDWNTCISQINGCSATIYLDLGDGTIHQYPIFCGTKETGAYDPQLTLEQALRHFTSAEERADGLYIGGIKVTREWGINMYTPGPVEYLNKAMAQLKNNDDLMKLVLYPNVEYHLRAANAKTQIIIPWAHFTRPDNSTYGIESLVLNGKYNPATKVEAKYRANGKEVTVSLNSSTDNSYIWKITPLTIAPDFDSQLAISVNDGAANNTFFYKQPSLRYVPLQNPETLYDFNYLADKKYNGHDRRGLNLEKYPDATSYVIQVFNDRWSTDDLNVEIEGRKVNLATGDRSCFSDKEIAGALWSPWHTASIVIPRPSDGRTSLDCNVTIGNWSRSTTGYQSVTIRLMGYFTESKSNGSLFKLIDNPQLYSWNTFPFKYVINTGKPNAKGYVVRATSKVLSSDNITVKVNGVTVELGSSDSHASFLFGGQASGAIYSPWHSETFFVPAKPETGNNYLDVECYTGGWFSSHQGSFENSNKGEIQVEVLGYFGDDADWAYSEAYTSLGEFSISDIGYKYITKTLPSSSYKDPKAYLVLVTDNRINGDYVKFCINQMYSYFSASATKNGDGRDPNVSNAPIHTHLMLVPADKYNPQKPLDLRIEQYGSGWMNSGGTYKVEVLGYFH